MRFPYYVIDAFGKIILKCHMALNADKRECEFSGKINGLQLYKSGTEGRKPPTRATEESEKYSVNRSKIAGWVCQCRVANASFLFLHTYKYIYSSGVLRRPRPFCRFVSTWFGQALVSLLSHVCSFL